MCALCRLRPPGARLPRRLDHDLPGLNAQLDFLREAGLLDHELGQSDALGIADSDDLGAHEETRRSGLTMYVPAPDFAKMSRSWYEFSCREQNENACGARATRRFLPTATS